MSEWLGPEEVRARLPLLVLDDVLAGTFYARDGLADPSGVVAGYAAGARRLGATLLTDIEVIGADWTQVVLPQVTCCASTTSSSARRELEEVPA
jgi:sarcosine oxidase subunit beta